MRRRDVLKGGLAAAAVVWAGPAWPGVLRRAAAAGPSYGELLAPDANGVRLPAGFTSRIIATTGEPVAPTSYRWHASPDGGGVLPTADGGWIYVSNSEVGAAGGGASAIRFDGTGAIVDAKRVLGGTYRNCAGGMTPWGTWLSCEEVDSGKVWEVDPTGTSPPVARLAMGRFNHEAAAVDPLARCVYMTEDKPDGALYRFRPASWPSLASGTLEVLTETGGTLGWEPILPTASPTPTRYQNPRTRRFDGGEGAYFAGGVLLFTTKGDNRVWSYEPTVNTLTVVYDAPMSPDPVLTGVDNIVVAATSGDRLVAEDGGNMEVVVLAADGTVSPFLRIGVTGSELSGLAFDPSGTRLYVSSLRNPGRVYEISGPFRGTGGPPDPPPGVMLTAVGSVVDGLHRIELTWTGAVGAHVDVKRNGGRIARTANDGAYTDEPGRSGHWTYRYVVCEVGGRCSNQVTVAF